VPAPAAPPRRIRASPRPRIPGTGWPGRDEGVTVEAGVRRLRYPGNLANLRHARQAAERFDGPIVVLHGHLHTAVTRRTGRILQLGCPAVVEWPHAWMDVTVETGTGGTQAVPKPLADIR